MQRNRGDLIGLRRQIYLLRSRTQKRGILPQVILQFTLFAGRQSRGYDLAAGNQHNLATRYERKLFRNGRVHLIADRQRPKLFGVASGTGGNRANESPIQLIVGIPPGGILIPIQRSREILLDVCAVQSRLLCVQSHDLAFRICEKKKITACELPKRKRTVPNGRRVVSGHQRFQSGKLG